METPSTTVLHLLTPGDGSDALLRVDHLRRSSRGSAHALATLGGPPNAHRPVEAEPDLPLAGGLIAFLRNIFLLRRELRARNAGILHSWGPAAHRLAGVTLRGDTTVRWVVSNAPASRETWWTAVPKARLVGTSPDGEYPSLTLPTGKVEIPVPPWTDAGTEFPDKSSARKQLGIPTDAEVVLCTTSLVDVRDVLTAVWANAIVAHIHAGAHFIGVGHGPGTARWFDLVERGQFRERAQYLPRAADWPTAAAAADVVLHTGLGDSVPAALATAVRCGLPAVVSGEGSARHMFPPGSISDVPIHRDGRSHAQSIHNLLTDAELRHRAREESIALAASWPVRDLNRLYQRLSTPPA